MNNRKEKIRVFQKMDKFVLRRTVETELDSEEFLRMLSQTKDNESVAESNVDDAKETLDTIKHDHIYMNKFMAAAEKVRKDEVERARKERDACTSSK